jgi:hypothetical protein
MRRLVLAAVVCALSTFAFADDPDPSGWQTRLLFHAESAYGPWALTGSAAWAGFLQEIDFPREWGQGAEGYGKRLGSTLAYSGMRNVLGFGLDSALHEDPRYFRSEDKRFWRRMEHVVRGTVLTRTDTGKETFSVWRVGSAYGATFLSNEWYPDRLNTFKIGLAQGTTQMGFDLLGNVGNEFWPDVKKALRHTLFRR